MKDSSHDRRFSFVLLGCVVVFSLVGFFVGAMLNALPARTETIGGESSIQPQFVKSLSAWVYIPSTQTNEARIEIRSGGDLSLPATVVTGTPGEVIRFSDSVSIKILQVDPVTPDSPPGSGLVVIQIVDDSSAGHRVLATVIGACAGAVCALVLWIVRKRRTNR